MDGAEVSKDLYTLSEPCDVGACDAFVSHSWHDDCTSKWEALSCWCETFLETTGRSPSLWLDKVCIDQKNIRKDLACLPVFLAACERIVIISGPTYTQRLWCCVELYVFFQMSTNEDHGSNVSPTIIVPDVTEDQMSLVRENWDDFDAAQCQCFKDCDKERILSVVNRFPGGTASFNEYVKSIAQEFWPCQTARAISTEDL